MNKYFVLLLSAILLFACHKSGGSAPIAAFPNQIGDHWVYKYSPSGSPAADTGTIEVDVVGQTTLPDGAPAKIWVTKYSNDPNYPDTSLVVDSASTVIVYFNNICPYCTDKTPDERGRYNFPLRVSDEWIDANHYNTTSVLDELSLQVPAGNFPNTFQLSRTAGYAVNSYTKDTIFMTPGIGITKYLQNEFNQGPLPGNGLWELASYQLK